MVINIKPMVVGSFKNRAFIKPNIAAKKMSVVRMKYESIRKLRFKIFTKLHEIELFLSTTFL